MSVAVTPKGVLICKEIAAALEAAGISAPAADLTKDSEGWLGQLLAALKQKTRTEAEELSKQLESQTGMSGLGVTEESSYMNQFSELLEHEDPKIKALAEQFTELQQAKAEEDSKRRHTDYVKKIEGSKILPAMKEKLLDGITVEQFSEEDAAPPSSLDTVIERLEASVPPGMQFSDEEAQEQTHEEGSEFFKDSHPNESSLPQTREEARAIVDDLRAQEYHRPEPAMAE